MKRPKIDTSGTEAAQAAVARAQNEANALSQNFAADLQNENLTQVVAGGSAADASVVPGSRKRRSTGSGLSSQLGIQ